MSAPGFLAVSGTELVNNARTLAYLQRGLGGSGFQSISGSPCPDLTLEAWPLTTCPATGTSFANPLTSNPLSTWTVPSTGAPVAPADWAWYEAGYITGVGLKTGIAQGAVLPDDGAIAKTVRVIFTIPGTPANGARFVVGKLANYGTANVGWIGVGMRYVGTNWNLVLERQFPGAASNVNFTGLPGTPMLGTFTLEVDFTSTNVTARLYSGADVGGGALVGTAAYGFSNNLAGDIGGTWAQAAGAGGRTEAQDMATATRIGIVSGQTGGANTLPVVTDLVYSQIDVIAVSPTCVATGDLYPADGLWPSDDLYPALYGEFLDPGSDNAPWADADRPESYGFLGILVDSVDGLDVTSTRSMDSAADGIGGILGPENLDPRDVTVKGWLIADGCSSMEYARRWLGDTLSGHLCSGCDAAYVDVRTTCGDDPTGDFYTNRWRIYDVGLASLETDTADQSVDCCYVTPVTFKLSAADPYLYGPQITAQAATLLNPDGADSPAIPFDDWLFGSETPVCTTVVDQGIGIDAAIFTFYGGSTGIEAGVVYPGLGAYPYDSTWPNDCLFPADGQTLWTDGCPFAFSFSIGAGETFVVDNARRRVSWILSDGTVLDGAPQMILNPGDVIQWIDTCAGASIDACAVAYAACTCDDTATVTIQTQHRER